MCVIKSYRRTVKTRINTKHKSPTVTMVDRPYSLYPKFIVRLPVAEIKRFPRVTTVPCTLWYRTLQWTLGYDTVIRRTWVMRLNRCR